jgi:hypothetical protein
MSNSVAVFLVRTRFQNGFLCGFIMSQSIPWVPIPPGRLSGICHFGEKMLQMPHHGVQIMQQNPHPLGTYIDAMPHPWGQNISFLRIFEPKNRMHALSLINISVFKIDSVAISFQNVFNWNIEVSKLDITISNCGSKSMYHYQQYGQEKNLKCVCPPWLIRNTHTRVNVHVLRTKIRLNGKTSDKYTTFLRWANSPPRG